MKNNEAIPMEMPAKRKLKKIVKPKEPQEPVRPIEPKATVKMTVNEYVKTHGLDRSIKYFFLYSKITTRTFLEVLKEYEKIVPNAELSVDNIEVYFDQIPDYYDTYELNAEVSYRDDKQYEFVNRNYKQEMRFFKKNLNTYNKKIKEYEKAKAKFDAEIKIYEEEKLKKELEAAKKLLKKHGEKVI